VFSVYLIIDDLRSFGAILSTIWVVRVSGKSGRRGKVVVFRSNYKINFHPERPEGVEGSLESRLERSLDVARDGVLDLALALVVIRSNSKKRRTPANQDGGPWSEGVEGQWLSLSRRGCTLHH